MKSTSLASLFLLALATSAQASITISVHRTRDESCTAGVCTPTGPNPNIRVKDLEKLLARSDMTIVTGQGATDIDVLDPLTWARRTRLTLDANQSIHIRAPIVVEGTGGVTLTTNDGGTGGDYFFDAPGTLTFWDTRSSLVINGASLTLVKDIATLANDITANPSGNYALAGNYDASADGTYGNAIGVLAGVFEGLGNTVANLTIASNQPNRVIGLFSILDGTIRDIDLTNVSVSGSGSTNIEIIGALVGLNAGTIIAASVCGSVSEGSGRTRVGGLVGANQGQIARSSFIGTLFANGEHGAAHGSVMGGLAGDSHGTILQSAATVDASGAFMIGGLVGELYRNGTITLCRAYGAVSGLFAGGLVGGIGTFDDNGGSIMQSFAGTSVTSKYDGGGLVGIAYDTKVTQSYSTGAVKDLGKHGQNIGGFVGEAADDTFSVSQDYAAGLVNSGSSDIVGGFVGIASAAHFCRLTGTSRRLDKILITAAPSASPTRS